MKKKISNQREKKIENKKIKSDREEREHEYSSKWSSPRGIHMRFWIHSMYSKNL